MTQTIATTDDTNDIYIGADGNLVIAKGLDAVTMACKTASKASLGEEVLSLNSGLPFFQSVFSGVPNLQNYQNYLRQTLESVDGVVSVQSISAEITKSETNRSVLSYQVEIESAFGPIQSSLKVNAP